MKNTFILLVLTVTISMVLTAPAAPRRYRRTAVHRNIQRLHDAKKMQNKANVKREAKVQTSVKQDAKVQTSEPYLIDAGPQKIVVEPDYPIDYYELEDDYPPQLFLPLVMYPWHGGLPGKSE